MLDPKLLKDIKHIQLTARHLASDVLAGNYASAFKGQGMEFAEVREYIPGDDVRSIDWNVTARMSQPFIKKYREERELTLLVLIDVSGSQAFGTQRRTKEQCSTELAAVLTYLATKNNDKVGVVLFSDEVEAYIPPKKGRAHIWHIIRTILTHRRQGKATRIDKAIDFVMRAQKKRALVFLISDFLASGYETALRTMSKKHEVICVFAEDARERTWPQIGNVLVQDQETGQQGLLFAGKTPVRSFQAYAARRKKALFHFFKRYRIESFTLESSVESVAKPLVRFLQRRHNRKAGSNG